MGSDHELSPREQARAACPPGRPRSLFTLDEIRARRRNSLELDRLCGVGGDLANAPTNAVDRCFTDASRMCACTSRLDCVAQPVRYVQPSDGYRPSQLPHNSDYGASPEGAE